MDKHPYRLGIRDTERIFEDIIIDLDERGWMDTYADRLSAPGSFFLIDERADAVLAVHVNEGERFLYAARHFSTTKSGGQEEVVYGIGKTGVDGHARWIWALNASLTPTGPFAPAACLDEDVAYFALRRLAWRTGQ